MDRTRSTNKQLKVDSSNAEVIEGCPLLIIKELEQLIMKNKKAPSTDGIPAEIYKLVFHGRPDFLLYAFNACRKEVIFPCRSKTEVKRKGTLSCLEHTAESASTGRKIPRKA